jgi:tripartite-type tricarboxylate transporter receptor subunit TctC
MFKAAAGIDLQHVPYKGSPQALTDLIGGQIQMMFDPVQSAMAHIQTGKVRAIAVTGEQRSAALPNVPTVTESGFPGFETTQWWGVFAPANLPAAQAATLAAEIERIVRSGAFRDRLEPLGVLPTVLSLSSFGEFQRRELAKWGKAVRDSGATVD